MKFVSRQQIQSYFDRVATSVDELSRHMRQAQHPFRDGDSYDYARLLEMGVDELFAPMATRQPKAHAALMALMPELLVCELTSTNPVGQQTWTNDAFVGSGERYVRVGASLPGASIAEDGERSNLWFRYTSLPPIVAESYYWHSTGLEVVHTLPSDPFQSRGLPAKLDVWLRADQVAGGNSKRLSTIKVALSAVAHPDATPRKDGLVWKSFACVLDSREQDAVGPAGDLLFVQERSPTQQVFHVHDGDFTAVRVVDDPGRLYDDYLAWVFTGGHGSFDFVAYSQPV